MRVLRVLPFPVCCGINVLGYFGWSSTNPNASGPRQEADLRADLDQIKTYKSFMGMTLVALADEQIPHVEYLLKEYGFVPLVKEFYHPGHGHRLTLYGLIHNTTKNTEIGGGYGEVKKPIDKTTRTPTASSTRARAVTAAAAARPVQVRSIGLLGTAAVRRPLSTATTRRTRSIW